MNIAITNVKLIENKLDAIRVIRKNTEMTVTEAKLFIDNLIQKEISEIEDYWAGWLKEFVIFDIVKTADELYQEKYENEKQRRLDEANLWVAGLSVKEKEFIETIKRSCICVASAG